MNSIDDSDVEFLIDWTKTIFSENPNGGSQTGIYGDSTTPVPADLSDLGILRIDIDYDTVRYVWLGGMDHTNLEIERADKGIYLFWANFDDSQPRTLLREHKDK